MNHENIISSINEYFSETHRSKQETLDGLEEILEELETLIETLEDDLYPEEDIGSVEMED